MKIVKILGGLGNQMFQYAFYISLRAKYPNDRIKVDCSYFKGYPLHNGLEIQRIFELELEQASFAELTSVTWPLYNYRLYQLGKRILPIRKTHYFEMSNSNFDDNILKKECYLDGYWQNECYFENCRDTIRKIYHFILPLNLKNYDIKEEVKSVNSVGLHVRRGDYLKHKMYMGICEKDYYIAAIKYIRQHIDNPCFFVFSNDIEWCKGNINNAMNDCSVKYIDWNVNEQSYIDMQLMSECKHNIIANSSFSWWGAWLNNNPNKIIVSPKKWLNSNLKNSPQCPDWILI